MSYARRTHPVARLLAAAGLCACPSPANVGADAGDAPGHVDAGTVDGGSAGEGEGEGEGEGDVGEGEGDCGFIPETLDDLTNEDGEPNYANCYWASFYDTCGPGNCVDSSIEQDLVDTVLSIAATRGYPPTLEFTDVWVSDEEQLAGITLTIDWLSTGRIAVHVLPELPGVINEQAVADEMPLWIPSSLPPASEVWAAVRACDADAVPYFCTGASSVPAYYVGVCGQASLSLWDFDIPGSGMSAADCYPSDLPCCDPTYP